MDWLAKMLGLPEYFLHHHPSSRGGGVLQVTVMTTFYLTQGLSTESKGKPFPTILLLSTECLLPPTITTVSQFAYATVSTTFPYLK